MSKKYQLGEGGNIIRTQDGAVIPPDTRNRDYRDFQAWVAGGNTPDPIQPTLNETTADLDFPGPTILQFFGG